MEASGSKSLWKKWGRIKKEIRRSDLVIKAVIAHMPGEALPSGTNLELILTRLLYKLYKCKKK